MVGPDRCPEPGPAGRAIDQEFLGEDGRRDSRCHGAPDGTISTPTP